MARERWGNEQYAVSGLGLRFVENLLDRRDRLGRRLRDTRNRSIHQQDMVILVDRVGYAHNVFGELIEMRFEGSRRCLEVFCRVRPRAEYQGHTSALS